MVPALPGRLIFRFLSDFLEFLELLDFLELSSKNSKIRTPKIYRILKIGPPKIGFFRIFRILDGPSPAGAQAGLLIFRILKFFGTF